MTWLYLPTSCSESRCAPAEADLISPSSWQFQTLEQFVWWRGKHSRSRLWSMRWSKVGWLRVLCGRMCEPSTADRGATQWIISLQAIRASRSAQLVDGSAPQTNAISGRTSGASSRKPGRGLSTSKTSVAISRSASTSFTESYADLVLRLRRDCLLRQRSATARSASACSSWPSPKAAEAGPDFAKFERSSTSASLETVSAMWYTPDVPNGGRIYSGKMSPTGMTADGQKRQIGLSYQAKTWPAPDAMVNDAVQTWPAPAARDFRSPNSAESQERRNEGSSRGQQLMNFVEHQWRAPTAGDNKRGFHPNPQEKAGDYSLNNQAMLWGSPRSSDAEKGSPNQEFSGGGIPLPAQTAQWMAPRTQRGAYTRDNGDPEKHRLTINGQAGLLCSRPDPASSTDGNPSSPSRRTLNPLFVEWLMGWPPGWIRFACSAMALSLYKRHMRFELSRLGLPPEGQWVQPSLFD